MHFLQQPLPSQWHYLREPVPVGDLPVWYHLLQLPIALRQLQRHVDPVHIVSFVMVPLRHNLCQLLPVQLVPVWHHLCCLQHVVCHVQRTGLQPMLVVPNQLLFVPRLVLLVLPNRHVRLHRHNLRPLLEQLYLVLRIIEQLRHLSGRHLYLRDYRPVLLAMSRRHLQLECHSLLPVHHALYQLLWLRLDLYVLPSHRKSLSLPESVLRLLPIRHLCARWIGQLSAMQLELCHMLWFGHGMHLVPIWSAPHSQSDVLHHMSLGFLCQCHRLHAVRIVLCNLLQCGIDLHQLLVHYIPVRQPMFGHLSHNDLCDCLCWPEPLSELQLAMPGLLRHSNQLHVLRSIL